jgi:ATP:corrinoid adenosyltransferase
MTFILISLLIVIEVEHIEMTEFVITGNNAEQTLFQICDALVLLEHLGMHQT